MGMEKTVLSPRQGRIILAGRELDYLLKTSSRSRMMRLTISPAAGLVVTIPPAYSLERVESVLREKTNWILSRLQAAEQLVRIRAAAAENQLSQLRYLGKIYRVVVWLNPAGRNQVEISGEIALVTLVREDDLLLGQTLAAWYRQEAENVFLPRIDYFSRQLAVEFHRVFFRNQKTRWGSCSGQKNLNFNIRLVMAPPEIIDYLVIHELAHLKEMNHSARFWAVVGRFCPGYKSCQSWLKQHGPELIIGQD